jgi:hypothetical protein
MYTTFGVYLVLDNLPVLALGQPYNVLQSHMAD